MKLFFDILRCMVLFVGLALLASCSAGGGKGDRPAAQPNASSSTSTQSGAQASFWAALESLCGEAFEGRVVEDSTASPDFARTPLVMHVRRCEDGRILVPFHIADDRSRTWVLTKIDGGLRLKHDHRHADGSEDDLTQYGGDTISPGTAMRQEFHADKFTASLLPAARTNIWTVEIIPGQTFAYALRREGTDRRFRVEFDLSKPVAAPPAPWGH
ncbi:MAG: hypothetical protein KF757_04055 [Phycisphaeraceae bacterium]|nr:hypothetical protein [Phycisphaeraceae bacterium]MCW5763175.1 hypothetical protein [Phycisphaeraceae bacterium]